MTATPSSSAVAVITGGARGIGLAVARWYPLCSPAASYINGQVLAVDGGFDASGVGLPTLRRKV